MSKSPEQNLESKSMKEEKLNKKRDSKHVKVQKRLDNADTQYQKSIAETRTKYESKIAACEGNEELKQKTTLAMNDALRKLDTKYSRKVQKIKQSDKILYDRFQGYINPNDIQKDMMRYRRNKLGYWLCFLAIGLDALGFCFTYSHLSKVELSTGIDIIYSIIFLLVTFITSERVKIYSVKSSYVAMVLGVLEIVHFFWYTTPVYADPSVAMPTWSYLATLVCYVIGGVFLLFTGFTNLYRGTILKKYLKEQAATDYSAALELKGGK